MGGGGAAGFVAELRRQRCVTGAGRGFECRFMRLILS